MEQQTSASKKQTQSTRQMSNGNLQILNERLSHVENEITAIREELARAISAKPIKTQHRTVKKDLADLWADNLHVQNIFDQVFKDLNIQGESIPAEDLQKMMSEEGLEPDELSRAIIAAREP